MEEDYDPIPTRITDARVRGWVFGIFLFVAFIFIYALGWKNHLTVAKQILVDKEYEYRHEEVVNHKRIVIVDNADSAVAKNIGYHHLRGGLICIGIGLYFIGSLFFIFKSRKHMLIGVWIPVIALGILWIYMTIKSG